MRPDLDEAVARVGVEHPCPAYRDRPGAFALADPLPAALRAAPIPRSTADPTAVLPGADDELALDGTQTVPVKTVPGRHDLPFTDSEKVTRFLARHPTKGCKP